MSQIERKTKVNPTHSLAITRQCKLLSTSRPSHHYTPREAPAEELNLLRQLDHLHVLYPCNGPRQLRNALVSERFLLVMRKRVRRLMGLMGISAVYPGKNTSKPN
ncbi:MAG: transposase, partial [Gammaproteobacteria bacterium]|nr:transposase [Gammaproteobacteria bacterium]